LTSPRVRVRFAPSPTGHLHVGGARTAVFNWLFARHHDGDFVVRVEDTDVVRSTRESEEMVLSDLRWLGLDWDEGPDSGGPHAPYRQSERFDLYARIARAILDSGHAYPCFCDEETLERKRGEAEAEGRPPHYDLTCHRIERGAAEARIEGGERYVVRFHVPKEEGAAFDADVTIDDLIRGRVTWKKESLGDFIVLRSDGMPTYNFSVVVDDHEMEISHVIRAEEHLTNTHRQVLIYRALGWEVPQFAHVSLILGQDRTKLSKRHGATSVAAYADEGFLPEAMVNYLTLLGWSPPDGEEVFTRESAVARFSFDRVNAAPAVFDTQKLTWMNSQYLHAGDPRRLAELVSPRVREEGWISGGSDEAREWLVAAVEFAQKGANLVSDLAESLRVFFEFEPARAAADEEVAGVLRDPDARRVMSILVEELRSGGGPLSPAEFQSMMERLKGASGAKGKKLFMPVRVALTGAAHGPELQGLVPLLERGSRTGGLAPVAGPLARVEAMLAAGEG
jgi:nondiscriminating glutamyl-tRNA synthetase